MRENGIGADTKYKKEQEEGQRTMRCINVITPIKRDGENDENAWETKEIEQICAAVSTSALGNHKIEEGRKRRGE